MFDSLIAGRLHGQAEQRTSRTGKPFVTARVRTAVTGGESMLVSVVAFGDTVQAALLALGDGDSVALAGSATPKAWLDREGQPRAGVDLVANAVLSPYHAKRRRDAVRPKSEPLAVAGDDSGWSDEA